MTFQVPSSSRSWGCVTLGLHLENPWIGPLPLEDQRRGRFCRRRSQGVFLEVVRRFKGAPRREKPLSVEPRVRSAEWKPRRLGCCAWDTFLPGPVWPHACELPCVGGDKQITISALVSSCRRVRKENRRALRRRPGFRLGIGEEAAELREEEE